MSHSLGIALKNVTAAFGTLPPGIPNYHLLLRVVQVVSLEKQKLTLPVREIWAGRTSDEDKIEYLIMEANRIHDDHEESATLEEANDLLSGPLALLTSLVHPMPYSGSFRWCTTKRVTALPCIWARKVREGTGNVYYIINETNLGAWLDAGAGPAQEFYDEENWTCTSCPDTDEEVDEDVDTEGGRD